MYRIKIILMLSTIIPSLDCCSSRTLFQKKPIHFYRAVELSMQKSTQFQQNDPMEAPPPPPSALSTTTTTGDDQTTISYNRHHHLHYDTGGEEESDKEEEILKLNRSQRSDLLNEQTKQNFKDKYTPGNVDDDIDDDDDDDDDDDEGGSKDDGEQSIAIASSEEPMGDAHYIVISQIVSIECVESFRLEFCLNGGRCFLYPILNESLLSCECADGFVGERCEAKSYKFIPLIRPRFVLAKTIGGPFVFGLAVIDILFLLFLFCKNCYRD